MDKDIERVIKKNQDAVDFLHDLIEGEPDMSTQKIKDELYKKFGYARFARQSYIVTILLCAARSEDERETVEED